jgi:hypothetical protein
MLTQPLGSFRDPVIFADNFKGMRFRTAGLALDMFGAMAPPYPRCPPPTSRVRSTAGVSTARSSTT